MSFEPFGKQHVATLGILLLTGFAVVWLARRGSTSQQAWLGRALGLVLFSYAVVVYIQKGLAGELSWEYTLPLELCHVVLFACVVSLFRPTPLLSEIAYFWGAAGTLQATLTPELGEGFPSWEFVLFFWSHGGILLAITFLIAQGFRPRPRAVLRMLVAVNGYALAIGAVDAAFGWNYGYLCRKPARPSLLDFLGPWPWYLLSLELVALLSFCLLDLPFRLRLAGKPFGRARKDSS